MLTLLHEPAAVQVQSDWSGPTVDEPFHPSPSDLAYDLAFSTALSGHPAQSPASLDRAIRRSHFAGLRDGLLARHIEIAYELGLACGRISGLSEPFPGYSTDEAAAYRRGFAAGLAEVEEEIEFEAWAASAESDRMEVAFSDPVTDMDIYQRIGAVS